MHEHLEELVTNLEIKVAYQEDALNQLDRIIIQQQNQIDYLNRQVQSLIEHVRELKQRPSAATPDEKPPHY